MTEGARPKQPADIKVKLTYNNVPKDRVVPNELEFPDLGSSERRSPTHRPNATKEPSSEVPTNQRETG